MSESHGPDPYEVSEATAAAKPKPWRPGCWTCFAVAALLSALLLGYGVYRFKLMSDQTGCGLRLRDVEIAAITYADNKGYYPYVGGDFEATVDMLIKEGYLDYRPICPHVDGPGGYDGFTAPFSSRSNHVLIAWDVHPHGYRPNRRLAFSDSIDVCDEAQLAEILALHDEQAQRAHARYAAKQQPPK